MNYRFLFFLVALAFVFSDCTTDFDLEAEWKDIPVVYGYLSRQDTAHYIRVEKAFLKKGGNANEIAQLADSLYYEGAVVKLKKVQTGEEFNLQKVDGNLEGYVREDGVFASSPNYLYKIKSSEINLQEEKEMQLIVERGGAKEPVTSSAFVLKDLVVDDLPVEGLRFFKYDFFTYLRWDIGAYVSLFDIRFVLKYRESDPNNPSTFIDKEITWVLEDGLKREEDGTDRMSYGIKNESFFIFLGNNLEEDPTVVRKFKEMDLYITGIGEELEEFIRVARLNSGITSSQSIPIYTNLSEGRGIFTSRTSISIPKIKLHTSSLDSLFDGIHTRDLNFVY